MQADLVLYNGDIHTMDALTPQVRAIAIEGNKIVATGNDDEIRATLIPEGRAIDLQGRTVAPGLIDAHIHFLSYGFSLSQIDLAHVPTLDEALSRINARAETTPAGRWLLGRGWDQSIWPGQAFPTSQDLDGITTKHPVFLRRKCGHLGWANSQALDLAGITAKTPDPPGGEIERDPVTGQPTGILKEKAMRLIFKLLDRPSREEAIEAIQVATKSAHQLGITSIHHMEDDAAFGALQDLHNTGQLKIRVLKHFPEKNLDAAIQLELRSGIGDNWLKVGGVKIYTDGALGGRTAHMLAPYEGEPNNYGIPLAEAEHFKTVVGKAARAGIFVAVHAIGDAANRAIMDAIEASRQAGEGQDLRHRIEHAQILHPDDLPRFAQLGVTASGQPIHATEDMLLADANWGARCHCAYAWRSLLESGAVLAFGSDSPVSDLNVIKGIHASVTRRRANGSPGPNGWYPEQRLTVDETVYAYTAGAAYAAGDEDFKGTLSPGKLADLVVLSQDIFTIDPMAIVDTEVMMTMIDGEFVFVREKALA